MLAESTVRPRIGDVALHIAHAVGQPSPGVMVDMVDLELAVTGDELFHRIGEAVAPLLHRPRIMVDRDEPESVG